MTAAQPQTQVAQSRVGKRPLALPTGVELKVNGRKVVVKGPKGAMEREFPAEIKVEVKDKVVHVVPNDGTGRRGKQFQGLVRALLGNMVEGTSKGFAISLDLI